VQLQEAGAGGEDEMRRVFHSGIGMVIVFARDRERGSSEQFGARAYFTR
jgi:phosphoribosylaminoimidazole (AIR) synthetase